MVARIKPSSNPGYILRYNEQKVSHHVAELIHSGGFLQSPERLSLEDKLKRFERLNSLNERARVNMLHISLNFHPGDQLSKQQLQAIADRYLDGIGFGSQPFLVYQHNDVGHPHLHIVTSAIRPDGSRIPLHNIGRTRSAPVRHEINKDFDLYPAGDVQERRLRNEDEVSKVVYGGDRVTKHSISDVLELVNNKYLFTSLQEYNAILRVYNVYADTGSEQTALHKNQGILYRALTDDGKRTGVPIKASAFDNKPTLANLELQFKKNHQAHLEAQPAITNKLNWLLSQEPDSMTEIADYLKREGIEAVISKGRSDEYDSLILVDLDRKTAVNSASLGSTYSLQSIERTLQQNNSERLHIHPQEEALYPKTTKIPQLLSQVTRQSPPHQDQDQLSETQQVRLSKRR